MVPLPWALPHKTRSRPFLPGAAEGRCSVCPQRSRPCCHLRGEQSPWAQVWLCRGGRGHFKKIKVISCCSCWQGPVRPEPGGLKQFHNPGDFLLIGIMKPITNIKSHSLKRQPERGRDTPGPLRPPGTAALAPPGKRCPPGTPVLRGGASGGAGWGVRRAESHSGFRGRDVQGCTELGSHRPGSRQDLASGEQENLAQPQTRDAPRKVPRAGGLCWRRNPRSGLRDSPAGTRGGGPVSLRRPPRHRADKGHS